MASGQARVAAPCPSEASAHVKAPQSAPPSMPERVARCTLADLEAGRWHAARRRLAQARRASAALPPDVRRELATLTVRLDATLLLDSAVPEQLARIPVAGEAALPWVGLLVRGVASARAAWATQDEPLLQHARDQLTRLEALARAAGPLSDEERARLLVQGAIAGAQYEREDMQLLLDAAHALEQRLDAGDGRWVPIVLARELEADLLRITDRYTAAIDRYRAVIARRPRRVQCWIGLALAYRRLGAVGEAEAAAAQARALWADADPEARAFLP